MSSFSLISYLFLFCVNIVTVTLFLLYYFVLPKCMSQRRARCRANLPLSRDSSRETTGDGPQNINSSPSKLNQQSKLSFPTGGKQQIGQSIVIIKSFLSESGFPLP